MAALRPGSLTALKAEHQQPGKAMGSAYLREEQVAPEDNVQLQIRRVAIGMGAGALTKEDLGALAAALETFGNQMIDLAAVFNAQASAIVED
jgi:hypothetical protein